MQDVSVAKYRSSFRVHMLMTSIESDHELFEKSRNVYMDCWRLVCVRL